MPEPSSRAVRVRFPADSREDVVRHLAEAVEVPRRSPPVRRVALSGAYAAGRHTGSSDSDVLVIYDDPPRPNAFALVKRSLGVRGSEPHVYSGSEYRAVRDVVDRMAAGGVVTFDAGAD